MTGVEPEKAAPRVWRALIGPLVSLGLLAFIAMRLDLSAIGTALAEGSGVALLLGMALLGGGIFMNSLRWRLAAQSAGVDVGLGLALRSVVCGTFYNLLLFGPAGGDIAKSATYARWYDLPLDRLLAASIVDRGFSVGGSILFFLSAVAALVAFGDLRQLAPLQQGWSVNWIGLLVALAILIVLGLLAWRRAESFLRNLARTFRDTVRVVLKAPSVMARGCLHGFTQQLLMSGVFVTCLAAVNQTELPWLAMAWAFPLVTAMTAMPFTFGGAGAREGVALLLLTPYGAEPEAIVAAGLLTLSVYLGWALIGAAMVAREWRRHRARSQPSLGRT